MKNIKITILWQYIDFVVYWVYYIIIIITLELTVVYTAKISILRFTSHEDLTSENWKLTTFVVHEICVHIESRLDWTVFV